MGGKGSSQPSGNTTTTQTSTPWSGQQPYLEQGFAQAGNLFGNYTPQYYPGATLAPPTDMQLAGNGLLNAYANAIQPLQAVPLSFNTNLLNGGYLNNDPSLPLLNGIATGDNIGWTGPGAETLKQFSNGSQTNPFLNSVAQSTLASVVPSIQQQFIEGGSLSSPQAAYATSQGATAALAPVLSNALMQEQQNQLGAAGQLAQNAIAGQGQKITAATNLGQGYSGDVQRMIQGLALSPQTLQEQFLAPQAMLQAGQNQQNWNQQSINDMLQRWNYQQTLPYQQLNEFLGQISGNYGGTTQTMNPYYQNTGANALSGGLGGAILGSQLLGPAGFGLTSSGLGAGVGGGLGLLLGLI